MDLQKKIGRGKGRVCPGKGFGLSLVNRWEPELRHHEQKQLHMKLMKFKLQGPSLIWPLPNPEEPKECVHVVKCFYKICKSKITAIS